MSERVYLTLRKEWDEHVQTISGFILAYLEIRLGILGKCKYVIEHGRTTIYLIFSDRKEAERVYSALTPNINGGVFADVRLKTSFRTDGRNATRFNGNIWHDR